MEKTIRVVSRVYRFMGEIYIKEKTQVKKWFGWKTVDTRFFGTYPTYIHAKSAIEARGGEVLMF